MADYEIVLRDPFWQALQVVDTFIGLDYARTVNQVGALTLTMPDEWDTKKEMWLFDVFNRRDNLIEIWRNVDGKSAVDMETAWLVMAAERSLSEDGRRMFVVRARDAMHLLARRHVLYASGTANASCATYADDALKAIVSSNLGSTATDAARDWSPSLSVQPALSLAPSVKKEFAWRNVLTICQEIAQAAATASAPRYLAFDLVYTGTSLFEFRTYVDWRGMDHRFPSGQNPVLLDPEQGNLASVSITHDYTNEWTHVTAAGQGQGAGRITKSASSAERIGMSPFGRIEHFLDARNTSSADAVQDEANAALRAGAPRVAFTGTLVQTPGTRYGVQFGLGDIVTATYLNSTFDARISTIRVGVADGVETIEAALRSDELL